MKGELPSKTSAVAVVRWRGLRLPAAFQALQHRNYRLLWVGTLISSSGDWMDMLAFNWLVYELSHSAVYLGLVNLCRSAPILIFTLFGGVVADRMERRKLIFTTQTIAMILAVILGILVSARVVTIWMVMLIAASRGIVMSFNQPARQSLISELVPPDRLMNAIALNSATLNFTRVLGPTIGGFLIATVGVAGAFYLNAASFLAVLWGLALMQIVEREKRPRRGVFADLVGGLGYLSREPTLRALVILALVPMILGMPYMTMLTVFAKDVLKVGGSGLGLLTACSGLGAVSGALFIGSLQGGANRGRLMLAGLVGFGASLLAFSFSPWLGLSMPLLFCVGASQQFYMTSNNTLIQLTVAEEYRGRVLSLLFINRGLVPLGTVLAGFLTVSFGPRIGLGAMAAALLFLALLALRSRVMALGLPTTESLPYGGATTAPRPACGRK